MKKSVIALLATTAAVSLIATACSSNSSSDSSTKTTQTAKKKKASNAFKGNTIEVNGLTIKITGVKFLNASDLSDNKKLIVFEYDITNHNKKPIDVNSAWITNLNAYQENKNTDGKLEVGPVPNDYNQILDNQFQKIKQGGHLNFVCAYELRSDTTPVVLKAEELLGEKVIGQKSFKIGTFQDPKPVV